VSPHQDSSSPFQPVYQALDARLLKILPECSPGLAPAKELSNETDALPPKPASLREGPRCSCLSCSVGSLSRCLSDSCNQPLPGRCWSCCQPGRHRRRWCRRRLPPRRRCCRRTPGRWRSRRCLRWSWQKAPDHATRRGGRKERIEPVSLS